MQLTLQEASNAVSFAALRTERQTHLETMGSALIRMSPILAQLRPHDMYVLLQQWQHTFQGPTLVTLTWDRLPLPTKAG